MITDPLFTGRYAVADYTEMAVKPNHPTSNSRVFFYSIYADLGVSSAHW